MGKKIVKIDGKTYLVDSDTGKNEEVETEEEEEKEEEKEGEKEETENFEEISDDLAEKIVSNLKLDKVIEAAEVIKNAAKKDIKSKKSSVLNLEKIMKKDISEMTTNEKVVGFFQAMIQNDRIALKALSEGVAADGKLPCFI